MRQNLNPKLYQNLGGGEQDQSVNVNSLGGEQQEVVETVTEKTFSMNEVIELCRTSLDFLAACAAPLVFKYSFPPVFISAWIWLLSYVHKTRDFSQLALGLPRGFGKTTFIKIFLLYVILFTNRKFILIINNSATLAENTLSDVIDMLDEPNIKRVFGDWRVGKETDNQSLKKFGYRGRNIILAAIGAGSSLRGLNIKNERPDVMVFDDIQSREEAESQLISTNLEKWMVGTAMKAKSPSGCMFLFIANMYPTKWSILRRLKANPTWTKFIAGGILANGTSLWEELQPITQLLREFENDLASGHPEIFYSEVLNDENAASNNLIDFSKIPAYGIAENEISAGNFVVIDPANNKSNSDNTAIGYFEVHNAYPVLKDLINKSLSPSETIVEAIKFCLKYNCRLVCIEGVAYQASLAYWFKFVCEQRQIIGIECVEIYPGTHSKNSRILAMLKQYAAGEIKVHPDIRPIVHLEVTTWNPLKTTNTDNVLDLMCYAPKVLEQFGEYIVSLSIIQSQETDAVEVPEYNSCF